MNDRVKSFDFAFGAFSCRALVAPTSDDFAALPAADARSGALFVCDANTQTIARRMARSLTGGTEGNAFAVLEPGEGAKGWESVEAILKAARDAGVGRDGLFVGIGGGVVTDLAAFAASVYMRGVRLILAPTTLLGMADAALGGKTGFDLFGVKNLVGTFRPADRVLMATSALSSLPSKEWKSGLAEVIKTAIIDDAELLELLEDRVSAFSAGPADPACAAALPELVSRCVAVKGRIVEADPTETGTERALLNLGHTFGHALESVAGLGVLTHGEAVAWGVSRSCALGVALGLTPADRARRITRLLAAYGYETGRRHPAAGNPESLIAAMADDKKKKAGKPRFIVPTGNGATTAEAPLDAVRSILE